ncbi:hypothetical protein FKM82_021378 [Ascaphus truei]
MAGSVRRPEHLGPPELFYNEEEARKYTRNSRMMEIQSQMSERAVELLCLPEDQPCLLLDVGCGSGLSGDYISELGHHWVGIDISSAMLDVALEREVEGGLILGDMGQGIPFRPGAFDGCISISALQWLCNADKKTHSPPRRLFRFFSTLYSVLLITPLGGFRCADTPEGEALRLQNWTVKLEDLLGAKPIIIFKSCAHGHNN